MSPTARVLLFGSTLLALSACTGAKMSMEDDDLTEATREGQELQVVDLEQTEEKVAHTRGEGERASGAEKPDDRRTGGRADSSPAKTPAEPTEAVTGGALANLGYVGGKDGADAGGADYEDADVDDMMLIPVMPESEPITAVVETTSKLKALELDGRSRNTRKSEKKASSSSGSSSVALMEPPAPPADPNVTFAMDMTTADELEMGIVTDTPVNGVQADNREGYTHYGINDMELAEKDRFSTFSIDVDTASYAISRRKLNEGWMPNTAGVRVEEFVNALHYDYDAPKAGTNGGAPFNVHMEAAPSPFQHNHHILRVGVQGAEIDQSTRAPMHLTFLVDTSGSMNSPDKLGLAKTALHELVDNLGPEDTIALTTYAGSSTVVLPATGANKKAAIHAGIESLTSGGGTHMDSGMNLAYETASNSYLYGSENRVVVLSDGDANIGRTSHDEILRTIQHYAEEGITLSTIGFGMGNYQDTMMEQLANKGDGNYFYIDTAKEAQKVFGEDLAATTQVIAKDVKIQVEFNPDAVTAYRLIGYENRDIADVDFRNDRVDAGEIGSGHAVTALYDVVLRDDAKSQELATVRIRAKKPGPDSAAREWATLMDGELVQSEFTDASKDFRLAFATASFAELLRGSPYLAEVSYRDVLAIAQAASRGHDEDKELIGLIGTAGQLSGERGPVAGR
ncbi:MAG: DUF3520 domain-containing protein [Proteobacteria bacterium]|nr:DUF3520 domain-containing protein [Pseudomonadota bacterium]MCP4919834.1 DUF3520 domain-containing protein [Pseudomonadota bacterium]